MEGVFGGILLMVILFPISYAYVTWRERMRQGTTQKDTYEIQKLFTHRNTVVETTASIEHMYLAVKRAIPTDMSAKAMFIGDNYWLMRDEPLLLRYRHRSKMTTGGNGGEFYVNVKFAPAAESGLNRATIEMDHWREFYGVTRKDGVIAMAEFFRMVLGALREVDPQATITYQKPMGDVSQKGPLTAVSIDEAIAELDRALATLGVRAPA